ncbi:MAG: sigma-54 dependent transcriptional regulator [Myxococcota bacterium]
MPEPRALIVDDDANLRESLELLVQRERFATRSAGSLEEAGKALEGGTFDVVLMDLTLPDGDGLAWLREQQAASEMEVIVITGSTSIEAAISALRSGALDYLTKPIDRARLSTALMNVARTKQLKAQVGTLRGELRELGRFGAMIGRSKAMLDVYDLVARVAPTDATVLITGESGTGKELVAQTIHALSARKAQVLLPVNCGAVSPTLIESELFGHERGSFTGADKQRKGYFERADGGTLFLDEVSEMPLDLQVKLLRVLETGTIVRVGGTEPLRVDVRVVAATNRNPEEAVKAGQLREDLYYRLNVFPIHMTPLRSRPEDIELLADVFLNQLNRSVDSPKRWSRTALDRLRRNPWTGNVRELKNVVQRAFIMGDEEIGPEALPIADAAPFAAGKRAWIQVKVGTKVSDAERALILATLEMLGDDKKKTAEALGLSLKTLYNRLNVYAASGALVRERDAGSAATVAGDPGHEADAD